MRQVMFCFIPGIDSNWYLCEGTGGDWEERERQRERGERGERERREKRERRKRGRECVYVCV